MTGTTREKRNISTWTSYVIIFLSYESDFKRMDSLFVSVVTALYNPGLGDVNLKKEWKARGS